MCSGPLLYVPWGSGYGDLLCCWCSSLWGLFFWFSGVDDWKTGFFLMVCLARLAAIAFLKPIFRFLCQKLVGRNFLKKLRNLRYGSCMTSKNHGVETVSRTFLSFRARLAAMAFLKPIFRFLCKKRFKRNSL